MGKTSDFIKEIKTFLAGIFAAVKERATLSARIESLQRNLDSVRNRVRDLEDETTDITVDRNVLEVIKVRAEPEASSFGSLSLIKDFADGVEVRSIVPAGARFLSCHCQEQELYLYFLAQEERNTKVRRYFVTNKGKVPEDGRYLSSFPCELGYARGPILTFVETNLQLFELN